MYIPLYCNISVTNSCVNSGRFVFDVASSLSSSLTLVVVEVDDDDASEDIIVLVLLLVVVSVLLVVAVVVFVVCCGCCGCCCASTGIMERTVDNIIAAKQNTKIFRLLGNNSEYKRNNGLLTVNEDEDEVIVDVKAETFMVCRICGK